MTRNESRNKSAICLFGLSADPPTGTGGHVGMVEALIPHLAATSEPQVLYLLPVYRHTFASKRNRLLPFEQRLAMCELAFAHVMQTTAASYGGRVVVEVSPAERLAFEWARQRRRSGGQDCDDASLSFGTATLLDYLRTTAEETKASHTTTTHYSLALGADTFCDLVQGKWKESQRVLQMVHHVYVFARQQASDSEAARQSTLLQECLAKMGDDKATLLEVDHLQGVSSSQARECTDMEELKEMLPQPVLEYILQNGLYAIGKRFQE